MSKVILRQVFFGSLPQVVKYWLANFEHTVSIKNLISDQVTTQGFHASLTKLFLSEEEEKS